MQILLVGIFLTLVQHSYGNSPEQSLKNYVSNYIIEHIKYDKDPVADAWFSIHPEILKEFSSQAKALEVFEKEVTRLSESIPSDWSESETNHFRNLVNENLKGNTKVVSTPTPVRSQTPKLGDSSEVRYSLQSTLVADLEKIRKQDNAQHIDDLAGRKLNALSTGAKESNPWKQLNALDKFQVELDQKDKESKFGSLAQAKSGAQSVVGSVKPHSAQELALLNQDKGFRAIRFGASELRKSLVREADTFPLEFDETVEIHSTTLDPSSRRNYIEIRKSKDDRYFLFVCTQVKIKSPATCQKAGNHEGVSKEIAAAAFSKKGQESFRNVIRSGTGIALGYPGTTVEKAVAPLMNVQFAFWILSYLLPPMKLIRIASESLALAYGLIDAATYAGSTKQNIDATFACRPDLNIPDQLEKYSVFQKMVDLTSFKLEPSKEEKRVKFQMPVSFNSIARSFLVSMHPEYNRAFTTGERGKVPDYCLTTTENNLRYPTKKASNPESTK